MEHGLTRRALLGAAAGTAASAGASASTLAPNPRPPKGEGLKSTEKLALLGGTPVRTAPFPGWPEIRENDEEAWMKVLRGKQWFRFAGQHVRRFEESWARELGAKHCLATSSGTTALYTALAALGVGPGDEVIVPPYTFVATVNAVLMHHALPVFVDSDIETYQIDARKVDGAVTGKTAVILPVHIGGAPADLDTILAIGKRRGIPVLEDACQAHWGEWRGRKLSSLGDAGCFSFQASKNLNSGEGGAILTNRQDLYEKAAAFHNQGTVPSGSSHATPGMGCNLRMTEFQGALLLTQLTRLDEQARTRERNAAHLTKLLAEVPGIQPAKAYEGCTRNAYHLYMLRYDKSRFAGVDRGKFLEALRAEGVPCMAGYSPLNNAASVRNALSSKAFRAIYSDRQLAELTERNRCPVNDRLCEEAVWLAQTMLLGSKQDMEQIAEAVRKIQANAETLRQRE